MSPRRLTYIVLASALCVLGGAWYFELVVKLAPCELCLAERWPWYAGLALALLAVIGRVPALGGWAPALYGVLFAGSAVLGVYHVGVEQHWIAGPAACTAASTAGLSTDALLTQLMNTRTVMCDDVQWRLLGVSLAGYNVLASAGLLALSITTFATRAK